MSREAAEAAVAKAKADVVHAAERQVIAERYLAALPNEPPKASTTDKDGDESTRGHTASF